jgi:Glutaminase
MKKYFSTVVSPTKFVVTLLLSSLLFFTACNNAEKGDKKNTTNNTSTEKTTTKPDTTTKPTEPTLLTIAAINEVPDSKNVEVRFYERAAIYTLDKNEKSYTDNKAVFEEALKANTPVRCVLSATKNAIVTMDKATDVEIRNYNDGEGLNSKKMRIQGAAPLKIDVTNIDTSVFNRVEYQVKFPVLRLCNNIVPNYATLVSIFNDCASQGCNNPPPYSITNCIPFQYVRDGCYARAHKMRQMIMKKYGYCVEKVFSFAEGYPKKLAVKANMWGGCCVEWWYHVVPLLRLNVKFGKRTYQICYVIDPGMFTTPVTLSTWLQAQKNTTCNPNATVTSYSIQPGSAYWPLGSSASFGTDPNYVQTEQTLIGYKNGVTCN